MEPEQALEGTVEALYPGTGILVNSGGWLDTMAVFTADLPPTIVGQRVRYERYNNGRVYHRIIVAEKEYLD